MDVVKYFENNLKEVSGNVAKAYLCVRTPAGFENASDEKTRERLDKDSAAVEDAILKAAAKKIDKKFGGDSEAAEGILKRGGRGESKITNTLSLDELASKMSNKYIPIQVQYNPNSITMSSDPGGVRRITASEGVGSAGEGQSIKKLPKSTELQCTLIVEKINVNDAFIQASEGWNASIGNVTSTIGDAAKKLAGGINSEPYSVRKDVEGFLSILCSEYTRDVIFYYGKMCFHGEMVHATATYKMFNKSGDPIYAEISIRIRQDDKNDFDNRRWKNAYEALFTEAEQEKPEEDMTKMDKFKKALGKVGDNLSNAFSGGIF